MATAKSNEDTRYAVNNNIIKEELNDFENNTGIFNITGSSL